MEKIIYMTEEQWEQKHKQEQQRKIKNALTYIYAFFLFTLPVWMFLDYIARGY